MKTSEKSGRELTANQLPPPMFDRKKRLNGLEFGRGIAASMVAMHHASNLLSQQRYGSVPPFRGFMKEFDVGVDFFFVLSGFIITWVHYRDIGRLDRLTFYLERRFTRIYPIYWCVLIPMIILHSIFPNILTSAHYDLRTILCSITLWPNINQPILGVAWTLVYEVYFYSIFGIVMIAGRRAFGFIFVWGAAILLISGLGYSTAWPESFIFDPRNLQFIFGVATAYYLLSTKLPYPKTTLLAGLTAFFVLIVLKYFEFDKMQPLVEYLAFGLSSAAIVGGVVELERTGRTAFGRIASRLGAASFSIYLVHTVVEAPVCNLLTKYLHEPELIFAILVLSGIGAGILFHILIEKPVTRHFRKLLVRPSALVV